MFDVKRLEPGLTAAWDAFCDAQPDAWIWHASLFAGQVRCLPGFSKDLRFVLVDRRGDIVAAVPLYLCANGLDGALECNLGGWSLPFPAVSRDLDEKSREAALRQVFETIDGVAAQENALRVSMAVLPQQRLAHPAAATCNPLLDWPGYLQRQERTIVLDLTSGAEHALAQVRTRFARYVRSKAHALDLAVLRGREAVAALEEYAVVERRDATQHPCAARLAFKGALLEAGLAFLIRARAVAEDAACGFLMVLYDKGLAFDYAVAVDDAFKDLRVSHAMKFRAIEELAARGCAGYELGIYSGPPSLYRIPDAKQQGITYFKTGFSKQLATLYIAEKFYTRDYLRRVTQRRLAALEAALFPEPAHD